MENLLNVLAKVLVYLQGKKTMIVSIAQALNAYAMATGMIDTQLGGLIASIILILGGGSAIATSALQGRMGK